MEVRKILCKSVLSKSKLRDSDYSINPYKGCTNSCVYCYAPYILREKGKWGTFVEVKENAPEVLEKELKKVGSGNVLISSVTDPYQPVERKYEITRKILEKLKGTKFFVSILTKSALVTRDIDLFKQLNCEVGLTITTLNDNVRKIFEPNASPVEERLNALRQLKDSGIKTYIFFGPVLPYISDRDLENTIATLEALGPEKIYVDRLNIKNPYQWNKLRAFLEKNYADMTDKWQKAVGEREYFEDFRRKVKACQKPGQKYEFCY